MSAALLLSSRCLAALRLLEDADLSPLPTGRAWSIVDTGGDAPVVLATGDTLAAAVAAALPVALAWGAVTAAQVDALDDAADDDVCPTCGDAGVYCPTCLGSGHRGHRSVRRAA